MMEQSIVSRSPSGQWYPQQQQQQQQQPQMPHVPAAPYNPNVPSHPQWSPVSGAATPMMMSPGGPNLGNSGTFGSSNNANMWNPNATVNGGAGGGAGVGGAQPGMPGDSPGRNSITNGMMTPQQQLMMQQGMLGGQDQCCAMCCGPQQQCCGPQQQCCGPQQQCCGPQQQCCGPQQQCCGPTGGCCPMPGEPVDPFCCTPPMPGQEPPCYVTIYNCFDWTFLLACLLFILTVVGFAVVVATKAKDDIFKTFNVRTTAELDAAMRQYIIWKNVTDPDSSSSSSSSSSNSDSADATGVSTVQAVSGVAAYGLAAAANAVFEKVSMVAEDVLRAVTITTTNATEPTHYGITHNCTQRKLLGSFGVVCMEDNLYANTFAVQLSSWTNARDTLWFLAMVYSGFTFIYAIMINAQRHPAPGTAGASARGSLALPTITPQEQEEYMKMTPQQQQAFMQEYQQRVAAVQQQNPNAMLPQPPGAGCCGSDSGIEFYDTPFYEFVRMAWFVSGLTAFVWTCNLFISFWAFSNFYIANTTGPLRTFWLDYSRKMNGSLVMVTIFLAWPLCCFFVELVFWLIGVLPWLVIRSTCKSGIAMYRPALPLSQLPMYIRADMFFMDFQDVKRLGFSRQAWMMLTGSDRPFFDSCDDPTVDKDPAMTQLMQLRLQWQQTMMAMMPPWMQQPGMMNMNMQQQQQMMMMMGNPNGAAAGGSGAATPNLYPGTPATVASNGAVLPTGSPAATPAEYPIEEEAKTHRRRRRSTHDRNNNNRHADPAAAAGGGGNAPSPHHHQNHNNAAAGMEQTSLGLSAAGAAGANSSRHRRRRHSRSRSQSKAAFESGAATPVPPNTDAAVAAAAAAVGGNTPGTTTRHRRRHSRSKEAGGGSGASPTPAVPVPVAPPGEEAAAAAGASRHRRHSRSRSKSKAAGAEGGAGGAAPPPPPGAAAAGADTQHRHRRRSHSRSREKPANKAAAAADLDALMQL